MSENSDKTWLGYYLYPAQWIESSPITITENNELRFDGTKAVAPVWSKEIHTNTFDFNVIVYRDGLFEFYFKNLMISGKRVPFKLDFTETNDLKAEARSDVVRLFNAHLACLYIGFQRTMNNQEFHQLRFGTYAILSRHIWGWTHNQTGGGGGFVGDLPHAFVTTRQLVALQSSIILGGDLDKRIYGLVNFLNRNMFTAIPLDAVRYSFDLLETLLKHQKAENLITVWALLAKSLQSFVDADYDWCLINAWVAIERIISDVWSDYLQNNRQRQTITGTLQQFINKKRLDELERYDASKKIEILSLLGVLDHRIYESLTGIRRKRNDWVHSLKRVEVEDANQAIDLLMVLLEGIYAPKNLA